MGSQLLASVVASGLLPLLAQAPEPEKVAKLAQKVELLNLTKLAIAAAIIGTGFMASRLVRETLHRLGEGNAKRRLLMKKITSFARVGLFAITSYLVVMTFFDYQEDQAALVGLGGTLAVALGFALKDISSSLMAGILILIDQPFQVGDRVKFEDTYGEVKEIGLRTVRIQTLDDNEVSIPNSKFLESEVASANAGELDMMVSMEFHISMTEDFELAKQILYEACTTSRYVFLEKPVTLELEEGVKNIAFCTTLRCKAYVIDARYEKSFVTDVTERAKRAFREYDIDYPYTREVQFENPGRSEYDDPDENLNPTLGEQERVERPSGLHSSGTSE